MKNKKGLATALQHFDEAAQNIFNSAISKIRQPIESLFNWINEHTLIQNASKVKIRKGAYCSCVRSLSCNFIIS